MSTPTYRGFVVAQTDTTYDVLSERDKQVHTLPKKDKQITTGCIVMPDGHICDVDNYIFNKSMLYSACREYTADLRRHKKRREQIRAENARNKN